MTPRQLSIKKTVLFGLSLLFWVPVILLSLLLVQQTIPYFSFRPDSNFLIERLALYAKPVWKISFYIHITAGMFCILTALLQFSSWILKKRKKIHVTAGKIYVFVVLLLGAPSGFYMTFFAKGGYWERACFMLMAVFWFYSTYRGFATAAREKNYVAHKYWMIRSYAMALTAVSFRVLHIVFHQYGMNDFDNYAISLWISVFGNALIAEAIVWYSAKNYMKTLTA
ncbi:MAG TPA: DUF2306 domain-containing protein [Bacteroidia bacterium]|nr:DUF2306 domain-containing protein [Bacteroidia bacterium]